MCFFMVDFILGVFLLLFIIILFYLGKSYEFLLSFLCLNISGYFF